MIRLDEIGVALVRTEAERGAVLDVLSATYLREKGWATDVSPFFPAADLERADIAWLVASLRGRPAGVLRVMFDPPLADYAAYGLEFVDPKLDVQAFLRRNRIAEIGRFAVVPELRRHVMLPAALMRTATMETVARGYTHFVTDVLEDDPHSPYGFHTRVLGFQVVATHRTGELLSPSRRITLVLDIKAAYRRLRARNNWFSRYLIRGWQDRLRRHAAA